MCYKERKNVLQGIVKSKDHRPKKLSKENTILYLKPVGKFDSKLIKELRFEIKSETLNGLNAAKLTALPLDTNASKPAQQQEIKVDGSKLTETVFLLSTQRNISTTSVENVDTKATNG